MLFYLSVEQVGVIEKALKVRDDSKMTGNHHSYLLKEGAVNVLLAEMAYENVYGHVPKKRADNSNWIKILMSVRFHRGTDFMYGSYIEFNDVYLTNTYKTDFE